MLPDEPTDEERQEELPEDNETPFRPAAPNPDPAGATDPVTGAQDDSQLDDTHQATDTNVQPEEAYDEGISGAAEAQEPNAGNAVVDAMPGAEPGQTITPTTGPGDTPTDDAGSQTDASQPDMPTTADGQSDVAAGEQPPA